MIPIMQAFPSIPVAERAHGLLTPWVPGEGRDLILHNIVSSGVPRRRISGLWRNTYLDSDREECDQRTGPARKKWSGRWKKPKKVLLLRLMQKCKQTPSLSAAACPFCICTKGSAVILIFMLQYLFWCRWWSSIDVTGQLLLLQEYVEVLF